MIRAACTTAIAALLATTGLHAQTVSAEPWFRKGTWMFSADLGGAAFTDFQRATARTLPEGMERQDYRRRISAGTTMTVGGSVSHWLTDAAALRAKVSWAPTRFSVTSAGGREVRRQLEELTGRDEPYARLDYWMADATVVFRLPARLGRVVPYALAGGGVVHIRRGDDAELPPEARRRFAAGSWTGPAAVFGLGATVPLQRRNLLMNFELTNHLTPTPLNDEGDGEYFEVGGIPFALERYTRQDSDGIGVTSNIRLTLGLTLPTR